MTKSITIRITDEQYNSLLKKASGHQTTVSDYIRRKLFYAGGWAQWQSDKQMNRINQAIWRLPENSTFTLPELLGYEWDNLARGEKLSLAKRYAKTVYHNNKKGDYSVRLLHDIKNDRNNKPKLFRKEQTKDSYYS